METSGFWASRRDAVDAAISGADLLVVAAAAFAAWLWWYRWTQRDAVGPKAWPVIGALPEIRRNWPVVHDFLTGFFHTTRTVPISLGLSVTGIFTVDPDCVEYILKTNFANYPKGPIMAANNQELLGHGIFNVDGEEWKQQRPAASSEFASAKLRDCSTDTFREHALKLASILLARSHSAQPFDLQDLLMRMTLDTTCQLGFGVDMGSLSPSLPALPFSRSFENANAASFLRFVDPTWRLKRYFRVGQERILREAVEILDTFTYDVIKARRADEKSNGSEAARPDLLSRFMRLTTEGGDPFDDRALRDVILNFIIAGRDTTAVAQCWFFYMLCCHRDVAAKLRDELASLERRNGAPGSEAENRSAGEKFKAFAELLTYENLGALNYLHATCTETLRLYPPVPMEGKYAVAKDRLPDGTKVERGNIVSFHSYGMGRMPFLWGPDALEFRPERWLRDGVFQPESPFKFTAFQAGPRLCLGRDSAYLQMKLTAALLVRFFDFRLVPGHQVHYRAMLLLTMINGLQVTASLRPDRPNQ